MSGKVQQIVTFRDLEYSKAERKARELVARSPSPKSFTIIVLAHQQTPEVIRA